MIRPLVRCFLLLSLSALSAANVAAQLPDPRLKTIFPPGAARGSECEVSIAGTDLDDVSALVFSHPGIVAQPKTEPPRAFETEPRIVADRFVVRVAADVPPGLYEARALGRFGLSTPRAFAIGLLPERVEEGNPQSLETAMAVELGTVVNGKTGNEAFDFFRFAAKAGERVTLRCEAQRIDSAMRPRMELLDAQGRLLTIGRRAKEADLYLDHVAPSDGDYVVKIFDDTYRGGEEFFYRLTLAGPTTPRLPRIDAIFPPVATPETTGRFELYGRDLPGEAIVEGIVLQGGPLERAEVEIAAPSAGEVPDATALGAPFGPASADIAAFRHRVETPAGPGDPLLLAYASAPIVRHDEPLYASGPAMDDQAQQVEIPCEIVGTAPTARDRDRFVFRAEAGERFAVEALSQKLGYPTDLELVVERIETDAAGAVTLKEIAVADDVDRAFGNPPFDRATRDPSLLFAADVAGEYRVSVRDLAGSSAPDAGRVYAIAIRPPAPDFRLLATTKSFAEPVATGETSGAMALRRGGSAVVAVQVFRRDGFEGEVTLSASDLPAGVSCLPAMVGPGRSLALLTFVAAPDAAATQAPLRIAGEASIEGRSVRRLASGAIVVREKDGRTTNAVARLTDTPAFSVIDEEAPLAIEIAGESSLRVSRAGKLSIPIRMVRREGAKGAVDVAIDGAPKELVATALSIPEGTAEGTLEIKVDPKTALGPIPFVLTAKSQVAYRRNPQAAAKLAEELAALDATIAKLTAENAAAEVLKAATDERTALEKRSQEAAKAAEAKDISVVAHSAPIVATVVEAPFEIVATTPAAPVARGGSVEIAVDVARSFGFAEPVEVEAVVPADFAGLTIAKISIPAEASQGKLTIASAPDGPTGEAKLILRAASTYEGARLQIERPLSVAVGPPAPATP